MLINLIKFIHLLLTITLLATAVYSLILICTPPPNSHHLRQKLYNLNKLFLASLLGALITGTLLVIPKHFTFQTHWIEAAYFLVSTVTIACCIAWFRLKKPKEINRPFWVGFYSLIILIFCIVIFEAVTKTSLFF